MEGVCLRLKKMMYGMAESASRVRGKDASAGAGARENHDELEEEMFVSAV